jgi:D-glycero-D-manno-heptose 1,7-bisphosphate phosphatase
MLTATHHTVHPALVLDLDGTVRYSKSGKFINGPKDIALYPDVEERIWQFRNMGYLIFGVTNQGGVAYGFKTLQDAHDEIEAMINLFEKNPFHIIEGCPLHESGKEESYKYRSLLRKPNIGMLAVCESDAFDAGYVVDWNNSLMVGDRGEDRDCAQAAGIKFQWDYEFFNRDHNFYQSFEAKE